MYSVLKRVYCKDFINNGDDLLYKLAYGEDRKFYIFIDKNRIEMTPQFCKAILKYGKVNEKKLKKPVDVYVAVFNIYTSDKYRQL